MERSTFVSVGDVQVVLVRSADVARDICSAIPREQLDLNRQRLSKVQKPIILNQVLDCVCVLSLHVLVSVDIVVEMIISGLSL